jgi:hypothetical protein
MSTLSVATIKSQNTLPPAVQNTSGTEIGTFCRAWVNFSGTGTVAIRASFNVSSITDSGTGQYVVNLTTAMSDVNFASVGTQSSVNGSTGSLIATVSTTSAVSVSTYTGTGLTDPSTVSVAVFR